MRVWELSRGPVEGLGTELAVAMIRTTDQVQVADSGEVRTAVAALAEEEEEGKDDSDRAVQLCQGEEVTIHNTWVPPLVLEVFQDLHTGPQEGPSSPRAKSLWAHISLAAGLKGRVISESKCGECNFRQSISRHELMGKTLMTGPEIPISTTG